MRKQRWEECNFPKMQSQGPHLAWNSVPGPGGQRAALCEGLWADVTEGGYGLTLHLSEPQSFQIGSPASQDWVRIRSGNSRGLRIPVTQNIAEEWFELTALVIWQLTEAGRATRSRCTGAWWFWGSDGPGMEVWLSDQLWGLDSNCKFLSSGLLAAASSSVFCCPA